jgi:hypothetical protein
MSVRPSISTAYQQYLFIYPSRSHSISFHPTPLLFSSLHIHSPHPPSHPPSHNHHIQLPTALTFTFPRPSHPPHIHLLTNFSLPSHGHQTHPTSPSKIDIYIHTTTTPHHPPLFLYTPRSTLKPKPSTLIPSLSLPLLSLSLAFSLLLHPAQETHSVIPASFPLSFLPLSPSASHLIRTSLSPKNTNKSTTAGVLI